VDFLIFLKKNIFLWMFWLEIWWDVVRYLKTPVLQLRDVSWVTTGRRVAWATKKQNFLDFVPFDPPKLISIFVIIIAKSKVLTDIFYLESLVPTILIWALRFFEWKQLFFLGNVKTGFSPKTTSPMRITYAKRFIAVFRIRRCVHGLSNSIHSRVREWEKWT